MREAAILLLLLQILCAASLLHSMRMRSKLGAPLGPGPLLLAGATILIIYTALDLLR